MEWVVVAVSECFGALPLVVGHDERSATDGTGDNEIGCGKNDPEPIGAADGVGDVEDGGTGLDVRVAVAVGG